MAISAPGRIVTAIVSISLIGLLGACSQGPARNGLSATAAGHNRITEAATENTTPAERQAILDSAQTRLVAQCDSTIARVSEATDAIRAATKDPHIWTEAVGLKLSMGTAAVTIASQDEPDVGILNITVMLTLESQVFHATQPDGRTYAETLFGPSSKLLLDTLDDLRQKAWKIDADYYAKTQLDSLQTYLTKWQERHPDAKYVAEVRLDSLMEVQGDAAAGHVSAPKFATIINIDEATRAVNEVRLLGEHALFIVHRMPTLLRWQVEELALDLANQPAPIHAMSAIDEANANFTKITPDLRNFLTTVPGTLNKLEPEIHDFVTTVPAALKDSQPLVDKLQMTTADIRASLVTIDDLSKRFAPSTQPGAASQPAGEPFSIEKYTEAATQLGVAANSLRAMIDSSDKMLETPAWTARFADINGLTQSRISEINQLTKERVDSVYTRVVEAIGVFFVCLVIYRAIATKLLPHTHGK